ncbi:unnamed protein product [Nezara viridula]|uniref:Uncharacterized protein n=1 Tax=Nezara viridula TaxID=85310 RepID=A0A9P0E425_NEZVI|nr:unnamed protein product [Nezara viridula]
MYNTNLTDATTKRRDTRVKEYCKFPSTSLTCAVILKKVCW